MMARNDSFLSCPVEVAPVVKVVSPLLTFRDVPRSKTGCLIRGLDRFRELHPYFAGDHGGFRPIDGKWEATLETILSLGRNLA